MMRDLASARLRFPQSDRRRNACRAALVLLSASAACSARVTVAGELAESWPDGGELSDAVVESDGGDSSSSDGGRSVDLVAFNALTVIGPCGVDVRMGSPQSLLTPNVDTHFLSVPSVQDGVLTVICQDRTGDSGSMAGAIQITTPQLETVSITGGGKVEVTNLQAESLQVSILRDSGTIRLEGEVTYFKLSIVDSGTCQADGLRTSTTEVDLVGEGTVAVCATDNLVVGIIGSGTVEYGCDPKSVKENVVGTGLTIRK